MSISYKPLREYLKENNLSPNKLYELGVITTNTATKINNDLPMRLTTIETICKFLDIPIERAVVFEKDN